MYATVPYQMWFHVDLYGAFAFNVIFVHYGESKLFLFCSQMIIVTHLETQIFVHF